MSIMLRSLCPVKSMQSYNKVREQQIDISQSCLRIQFCILFLGRNPTC